MDYLVEEVLIQQPAAVQTFLLRTSILERMCAPLCEAVVGDGPDRRPGNTGGSNAPTSFSCRWTTSGAGIAITTSLATCCASGCKHPSPATTVWTIATLHRRASQWYEANGLLLEAYHHAVAANDVDRAAFLVEGNGMPLHFRGAVTPVLSWLAALPTHELDAHPNLWITYASALLFTGQLNGIEPKAESGGGRILPADPTDAETRDLVGRIASIRATVAVTQHQDAVIVAQAQRALRIPAPGQPARAHGDDLGAGLRL
jgi:LuxR family maltose regulon positive regulatory protein